MNLIDWINAARSQHEIFEIATYPVPAHCPQCERFYVTFDKSPRLSSC